MRGLVRVDPLVTHPEEYGPQKISTLFDMLNSDGEQSVAGWAQHGNWQDGMAPPAEPYSSGRSELH